MHKIITTTALVLATTVISAKEPSKAIKEGVKNLAPTATITSIEKTPIKGVSEIVINSGKGGEVYYISDDGKYLLNGNMFDTTSREDLTESKKSSIRKDIIAQFGKNERIDFFPKEMKHHIFVFTDIDCGYCRKLHNQMDEYNELGIGISYLFYPRAGINSPAYDIAVTVWCSDDQQEAMTNAKSGVSLDKKTCDNSSSIEEQFNAGKSAGVTGTPAIVLENGKLMPGYLPPDKLLQRLNAMMAK